MAASSAADLVWAVSEADQEEIQSEIPGLEVTVVSNVHEVDPQPDQARASNNILFGGDTNTILSVLL